MATKIHEIYRNYYGTIMSIDDIKEPYDIYITENEDDTAFSIFQDLIKIKVKNILFDTYPNEKYADTIFFTITEETDMKKLLIWVANMRFDEFHEVSENAFRCWYD